MSKLETVKYQVEGPVATITMNRPEAANAQNSQLIDDLGAAFARADADADVRVVVLAGEGKHFSAGHDLKQLTAEPDEWARMRETPEGKWRHEEVMYWERCLAIRDFRKPTIAAVQGSCVAAGLMLACMCDLIVAADDASFANPVLRMSGAAVELLVEPWELGLRKAKEFLFLAETLDAETAERLGLVNAVVPRDTLASTAREWAEKIAAIPPETAMRVKDSLNHTADLMGQRDAWKYHFAIHQYTSNTQTALDAMAARKEKAQGGSMDAVYDEGRE